VSFPVLIRLFPFILWLTLWLILVVKHDTGAARPAARLRRNALGLHSRRISRRGMPPAHKVGLMLILLLCTIIVFDAHSASLQAALAAGSRQAPAGL